VQEMRKMILDEVMRFRHHVRHQPTQTPTSANMNVPIPENPAQWTKTAEDPRPQEAGAYMGNDLEHELQAGSDLMRR